MDGAATARTVTAGPAPRRGGRKARLAASAPLRTAAPAPICDPPVAPLDQRPERTLVIACGALARELVDVVEASRFAHMDVTAIPAKLHNRPEKIPHAVRCKIRAARRRHGYGRILVLYGDCGTGGELDRVLAEEGVERIEGAHCYAFYLGLEAFDALHDEEPGTFYLTDYLVRHFDSLMWKGLGLDRHPELLADYFGNYRRLVYLRQVPDAELEARARAAAARLGLAFALRDTGLGGIGGFLAAAAPPP